MIVYVDQNYPNDEAVFDAHEARILPLLHQILDETPYSQVKDIDRMNLGIVAQVSGVWKSVTISFHVETREERLIERDQAYSDTLLDYYGYATLGELRRIYARTDKIQSMAHMKDEQIKTQIDF